MEKFLRKNRILILIVILALAAFFRLWQLPSVPPGLYSDEAMNANNALEAISTGDFDVFYPENNGREGLYINIAALFLGAFGNEPWALRLASAFFGILTVLGLYLLARKLFKRESVALLSSFLLSVSFWHINFSRIGFRAIMAPAFLVWSMWLLWRVLGGSTSNWRLSLQAGLAGLLFGLGFHSYIAYRVAPLLLLPPFIIAVKNKNLKPFIIFLIGAFLAALPLLAYFAQNPEDIFGRTSQISIFASENPIASLAKNIALTIGMFFAAGDFNWRHNFSGAPQLWWPVAIMFLFGIIISLKTIIKKSEEDSRVPLYFLFLWMAAMLLPVVVSNEGMPHSLRAIVLIPPVMIFSALGFEKLLNFFKNKWGIIAVVIALLLFLQAYNQYFVRWANNPNVAAAFNKDLTDMGLRLNGMPDDIPKYVIIDSDRFDFRGYPMSAQPIMFITRTFLPEWQKEKNLFYILEKDAGELPAEAIKIWIK